MIIRSGAPKDEPNKGVAILQGWRKHDPVGTRHVRSKTRGMARDEARKLVEMEKRPAEALKEAKFNTNFPKTGFFLNPEEI